MNGAEKRLNVLVSAYAVSPSWGSEPGMGWNWVINLANYCNVHVITEGEWRDEIEAAVSKLSQRDNLHFYYNPLTDKVRKMCWNQGDWRFYWYYRKWQKKTLEIARYIITKNKIDVIHQLNMIGFREPGYLWKIKDIPFVWGPVGGMGSIPVAYLKGAGWKQNIFCRLKNTISDLQARFSPRVRAAIKRGTMIAATKEVKEKVKNIYSRDIPLINETGCYPKTATSQDSLHKKDYFDILWIGRFIPAEKLNLALSIIANIQHDNVRMLICGEGDECQNAYYRRLASELGIKDKIEWRGCVENSEVKRLMTEADLFLFTSIMEATSTVVLEAIEAGLPILSFDTCGFGPIGSEFAGTTIPLTETSDSSVKFAEAIDYFIDNKESLNKIVSSQKANRQSLTWNNKVLEVIDIYNEAEVNIWLPINCATFNLLWVGKFDFRKQFELALHAVSLVGGRGKLMLHVVSPFESNHQRLEIERLISSYNLQDKIKLYGRVPHEEVLMMMKKSDALLFTSIMEGTPHVVLEAIQNSLPVICFDTCGQGDVVNDKIGVKIALNNPNKSAVDFAAAITLLAENQKKMNNLRINSIQRQKELSWDNKIKNMIELYNFLKVES